MKDFFLQKRYSESTKKLHIPCPFSEKTNIKIHVVVKNGYCYRSESCIVVQCKYNKIQTDIEAWLSLLW
jgi:hypothetical protein